MSISWKLSLFNLLIEYTFNEWIIESDSNIEKYINMSNHSHFSSFSKISFSIDDPILYVQVAFYLSFKISHM